MQKDSFYTIHPIVNFIYFVFVIAFLMLVMHPVIVFISFTSACVYAIYLDGKKAVKFLLCVALPLIIIVSVMNPLFNHAGTVPLFFFENGNAVTLEAVLYGAVSACMFAALLVWFSCVNSVMTSDKYIYLTGRILPALSLIFSMALRFIPRFTKRIEQVSQAQHSLQGDCEKNIINKIKFGLRVLSITITWSLENAVTISDSMHSRGYGQGKRSAYSIYRFDRRDITILSIIVLTFSVCIALSITGNAYFRYFPSISYNSANALFYVVCIVYAVLCNVPILLNIKESLEWKRIQSRI